MNDDGTLPVSPVKSGFLRSGMLYTLGNFASAVAPFLLLPLLTRVLSVTEYGQVVNFFLLVSLSNAVAGLSLHGAIGIRWFSMDRAEFPSFVTTCLTLIAISTFVLAGLEAIIFRHLDFQLGLNWFWILAAVLSAGAGTVLNCRLGLWQNQRRVIPAVVTQFGNSFLNLLFSVLGVIVLGLGSTGRMGGAAIASFVMAAIAIWSFSASGEARGRPTIAHATSAMRFGVPLIPHTIAGIAMVNVDRFVVTTLMGTSSVGLYGVAAQLGLVMTMLGDAFAKSCGPWIYERLNRKSAEADLAVIGLIYLFIPIFLMLAAAVTVGMRIVGPLILGSKFHAALPLVGWFALGGAFNGMYLAVVAILFFASRTELVSLATVSSGIFGAALCYILVGKFGLNGGGAAFAATQAICFGIVLTIATRLRVMPWSHPVTAVKTALRELR